MSLLNLLIVLVIVGFLLWLLNTYIPMDAKIRKIINIIVLIVVVIYVLKAFGLLSKITNIQI